MKITVGVLAVLFLAATAAMAMDQSYQPLPFPQAANTALNASADTSSAAAMPSSMAANQDYAVQSDRITLSSPFPQAANPGLKKWAPLFGHQNSNEGSPFPQAANPSLGW